MAKIRAIREKKTIRTRTSNLSKAHETRESL